jgi:hypothetical protein
VSPIEPAVVSVAAALTGLIRRARETVALDRRYTPEELAGVVAWLLDDGTAEPLSAAVSAQADGAEVAVVLRQHDGLFGRTSEDRQEFVVTVARRDPAP